MDSSIKFNQSEISKLSLSAVLGDLEKLIPNFSIWKGELLPVLYMDEVNALEKLAEDDTGKNTLDNLLEWIIGVTKEDPKFHVILGTSDSFFANRIFERVRSDRTNVITIGDLSADEAKGYFDFILQNYDDEKKELLTKNLIFEKDVYPFVGGRMFHIQKAISQYLVYGTKGQDMRFLKGNELRFKEALYVEKGSSKENFLINKLVEWEEKDIKCFYKEISEKGFIVAEENTDVKNRLRMKKLLSMTKNNLLNFRFEPPITEDIKGLTEKHYPVFVPPSPIDLGIIKKIVSELRI